MSDRVLVVEDEAILAMELEFILAEQGFTLIGPAARVETALELVAAHELDAALLDFNLHGKTSAPVADRLADLGVPFLFMSGHTRDVLPERHRARPMVAKPFFEADLLTALGALLG